MRLVPHPSLFLRDGSAPAAGLPDMSHGSRPSAVGDVLRLEARRARAPEAERHAAGQCSGPPLPGLPHAGRRPRGTDGVGLLRRATAPPRRSRVARRPVDDPAGARRARRERRAHAAPRQVPRPRHGPPRRGILREGTHAHGRHLRHLPFREFRAGRTRPGRYAAARGGPGVRSRHPHGCGAVRGRRAPPAAGGACAVPRPALHQGQAGPDREDIERMADELRRQAGTP